MNSETSLVNLYYLLNYWRYFLKFMLSKRSIFVYKIKVSFWIPELYSLELTNSCFK